MIRSAFVSDLFLTRMSMNDHYSLSCADRASPVLSADEDVHNPSADGVRYVSGSGVLHRSETDATTRGVRAGVFW